MWYDVNKTLSHNCLFNFVVGPRGVGKTYSAKKRVIKNFLNKGEQFVYVRRYDTEITADKTERFFDDIQEEFPDHFLEVKGKQFFIDQMLAGFAVALSKAAQLKSVPFPRVSVIIFDEFIIDTGFIRYLPNEVVSFNELYSTIARTRDVTVLFLSNAITFTNPYFVFFNLSLQKDQKLVKKGDILLEMVDSPEYVNKVKETRFGKIIANTDYGRYAMDNQFLRDNDDFIFKPSEPGITLFNIKVQDMEFTVYRFIGNDKWWVSRKVDKSAKRTISVDLQSHTETTVMSKESNTLMWWNTLKEKFFRAEVTFSDVKTKNLIIPYLKRS